MQQKHILPALLHGKLVDVFIALDEEIRGGLMTLKKVLMSKAGLIKNPLVARKKFIA